MGVAKGTSFQTSSKHHGVAVGGTCSIDRYWSDATSGDFYNELRIFLIDN